jgi:hypothetical protein
MTSEMAAIIVFLLGGATLFGLADMAVALAIVTSAVLAYKQMLHQLVAKIGREDLYAGLRLLVATFIVLPVLPNHAVDPWGAITYLMWWLVILASLSLVGYVATRALGAQRGTSLTDCSADSCRPPRCSPTPAQPRGRASASAGRAGRGDPAFPVMFVRILEAVAVVHNPLVMALLRP